jgi:hypothetical protein
MITCLPAGREFLILRDERVKKKGVPKHEWIRRSLP